MRTRRLTPWRQYLETTPGETLLTELDALELEREETPLAYDPIRRSFKRMMKQITQELDRRAAAGTANLYLPFKEGEI